MEDIVTHPLGVNDESSLGLLLHVEISFRVVVWGKLGLLQLSESRALSFSDHIEWCKSSILLDYNYPPVVESALPEFPKVNRDLSLMTLGVGHDISFVIDFVPGQNGLVKVFHWGWGTETYENLRVRVLSGIKVNDDVDHEVLANDSNNRTEGLSELPVKAIVKHVQKDDCLVTDGNVRIPKELDKEFLDPLKGILVIGDQSEQERLLDVFQELLLPRRLASSEFPYISFIDVL